jgi:Double zinc ribbon
MTEQQVPCPRCRQENPPGNRFCGSCGVQLISGEQLATRQEHSPVQAGRAWPAKLSPVSKTLAVGVAVLATTQDRHRRAVVGARRP